MSRIRTSLLASAVALLAAACTTLPPEQPAKPPVTPTPVPPSKPVEAPKELFRATTFAAVPGWDKDNLREAWPAFMTSCEVLVRKPDWKEPCQVASTVDAASERAVRIFFESFFVPYQVFNQDGTDTGLVTGYYEPLLRGARKRGGPYQTPLHRAPDDLLTIDLSSVYPELKSMRLRGRIVGNKVVPYPTRGEMMQANALTGKELVWVDDTIEAFFLQVQGSGRVQLADSKETIRVAYADQNGHPYKSIGRYLVDKGEMTLEQASAQSIKSWFAANPARQQELLNANPSYVFFKEEKLADPNKGPKGALGVPLTPQRSIAVDPQFIPLGIPVFMATTQPGKETALQRLMLAQDTGGAIRNPVRADFFWGFGSDAGEKAGKMKQRGQLWILLPKLASPPVTAR
ncbi:murein transglycosylase A [Noviherbaspirillum denitrificans]|uniref:peptidoglycan lytic exotransglycosylase n=1 Tax=Noviherbaspirillum denitrificans TaxID=1968433 RepID=A0A254TCQ0_9BURK|nr:murein transglycosylase A [Noviherbaspirillum denitrificans]OWW19082.1 murein transglycosylase [Noviherbaspirillum denitrificans]